ncbi:MAG: isoprenylcysteine carboxylmethyltransferase family protein [Chloroflexota bacterium]
MSTQHRDNYPLRAIVRGLIFDVLFVGGYTLLALGLEWLFRPPKIICRPYNLLGLLALLAGASLSFWCSYLLGAVGKGTPDIKEHTTKLVTTGPYAYTRNPKMLGVALMLLGMAILLRSLPLLFLTSLALLGGHFYLIFEEEKGLEERFGEEYLRYKEKVPRWIPRFWR